MVCLIAVHAVHMEIANPPDWNEGPGRILCLAPAATEAPLPRAQ